MKLKRLRFTGLILSSILFVWICVNTVMSFIDAENNPMYNPGLPEIIILLFGVSPLILYLKENFSKASSSFLTNENHVDVINHLIGEEVIPKEKKQLGYLEKWVLALSIFQFSFFFFLSVTLLFSSFQDGFTYEYDNDEISFYFRLIFLIGTALFNISYLNRTA